MMLKALIRMMVSLSATLRLPRLEVLSLVLRTCTLLMLLRCVIAWTGRMLIFVQLGQTLCGHFGLPAPVFPPAAPTPDHPAGNDEEDAAS